tara:strand:+ start:233 stop:418 length:186 start_codon:yes stop_codon:yes gene_type:complete
MDPSSITLDNLTKSFEYTKLSAQIDTCEDTEELRNIAKCFCKLYYKQQETMQSMGLPTNGD